MRPAMGPTKIVAILVRAMLSTELVEFTGFEAVALLGGCAFQSLPLKLSLTQLREIDNNKGRRFTSKSM